MNDSMSIPHLIMNASLVVQLVMLLLLAGSIASWVVIFQRSIVLRRAKKAHRAFEDKFWSGVDLNELYREKPPEQEVVGAEHIFRAGFREFNRLMTKTRNSQAILDGVQRAMRVAWSREEERLNLHLIFLATVASASPYIGLFGTVWGIMGSFQSLSMAQQATLSTVAPWIAEALIATAMGLFAAIPAVIFYNRLSASSNRVLGQYEDFAEEFHSILHRNLQGREREVA
ncbi:protein TolQ [Modicisalibacter xianhensis]|uniref:Tol-Pal system protein TolQ n=2 Tax=Modicisalibacter xianhensis TaxID=442341 RepID=A0A1I3CG34_9GAMM|nr:protein TolQ [Halomonas xianhensis]TDX29006.1 cell division and transport-associated protein TolQ [Halomonas xianhensis]SFH73435.1 Cell division and transport-associated protein TolQ (TC 2.C.1.2.1) [Halomonas xianhensis]